MTPKIINKEEKRTQILRAAINVFSDKGLADFKIIDIARQAGVGKGTIYEYFRSKDDIILGCFQLFMHDFGEEAFGGIEAADNPEDKIRLFFRLAFDYFSEHKKAVGLMFDFWAASIPRKDVLPIITGMEEMYHNFQIYFTAILDDGVNRGIFKPHDTKTSALVMLASIDGLLFQAVLGVTDIDNKTLPDKLSDIFLKGILK